MKFNKNIISLLGDSGYCHMLANFKVILMGNKYQIPYINACIRAFAKRFQLSVKTAFEYLYNFKGIDFLVEFYEIEHLQSLDDAVDDLIVCCLNNGGTLR